MSRTRRANKDGGSFPRSMWAMENMIDSGVVNAVTSCKMKRAYSVGGAAKVLAEMRKHNDNAKIYHCRFCNQYHLTSMGARGRA